MMDEFTVLIKKHTDARIERTKTELQEKSELKLNNVKDTSFFLPLSLGVPKGTLRDPEWLLTVTNFETCDSVST